MDTITMDTVYDVCVVGAGVMGSSTARHLAKLGKKTILLEQFPLPHWRGSSHGQTRVFRCIDSKPHIVKMASDALEMWKEIEREAGETIMKCNVGTLHVEAPPGKALIVEEQNLLQNNMNTYQLLSNKELKERFPELRYGPGYKGLFEKTGGILMADKCLKNLQNQFVKYGGTLCDNNKVDRIEPDHNGVTIVTHKSIIRCKKVILTTGPWINKLLKPLGIQLDVKTALAPVFYWRIKKPGAYNVDKFPCFYDPSETDGRYIFALPSMEYPGLLKLGPTGKSQQKATNRIPVDPDMRDFTTKNTEALIASTADYIEEHLPFVDATAPAIVEKCIYTLSFDRNFIIDRHPGYKDVIIASGFSGQGFKHAPVVGKILSELALEQTPSYDISHFKIQRFLKPMPSSL